MNVSKIGLLLIANTALVIFGVNAETYKVRVGQVIDIPVGPIESFRENTKCRYDVANQLDENILTNSSWIIIGRSDGKSFAFHSVKAVKPGTVTITYDRMPDLNDCDCDRIPERHIVIGGEVIYFDEDGTMFNACLRDCMNEEQKQAQKDYKTVTVTVLPAE